jgi:iron complex outermembrane receptor protein
MRKNIPLFIVILFISNLLLASDPGFSKTSLSGKITDKESGEAITGATVYVPDLQSGAVTDTNGFYKIDNLPQTKILIQVSFLGYKPIVEKVDLSSTTKIDFVMEQAVAEMKEIVVTGTSGATEIKRNPVPMVTLDRKEFEQNLNTNIIDAIANLPGISAVTTGPNVSKPFIHGLGYNRVLTLYDGVRQEGQQWGDEHGIEVDENSVDRIEIVKGPASLTYGSDALAGVVNLLPAPPVPDGTIKGYVLTNYQTNNGLCEASAKLAGNTNGFIWGGVASHKQATNYQNKHDGRVYGTAFNETDLNGYIGLNKQWGYSHLNFFVFDDLQEIPDGSRYSTSKKFTKQITEIDTSRPIVSNAELNSYKIAALHQHVQHYKIYSSNNFIFGESKLGVIIGFQENVRREFSHPQYPEIAGLYLILNTFTYDIKYYFPEFYGWESTIGVNGMYQNNTNKGTEFIIPDYSQFDMGPFVLIKKTFDKLDISAGARYDIRIFNNDAMYTRPNPQTGFDMQVGSPDTAGADQPFKSFKHTFSGMSGSIGATYNISNEFLVKGNIGRGFRAPNIAEISANGVHPGTDIYQIGNTGFKPEFSLQEDLGISFTSSHVTGYLDVFNNNISNYIFNQKLLNHLGQDSIIVKGNETYKFQQAQAQLYGGEASLDIHPHPLDWLHFENSISVIYALNKGGNGTHVNDSSKYLPFIPPLHTNSELRANIRKKFKHFSSLYAKIGMEYYAKQNRVYLVDNTETVTPSYILYNAGLGADVTNDHGKVLFSIDIMGNNITNVAYQSHMSRLKYMDFFISKSGNPVNITGPGSGIYNMGRNIGFKVIVPLYL